MKLVIVESPTKAKTIERFLGGDFIVKSSFGHIRDLPKGKLGIDVEGDFTPQYVVPRPKSKIVTALKKDFSKASALILATDEDREGEAIAWHIGQAVGLEKHKTQSAKRKTIERIVFHEITKTAIEKALKNPREIDMDLVDAQQARRVLDRLVGYKLSPFLWYKIAKGLSAGRVQSVAVRLVVEREREIEKFIPQEYWSIEALLAKNPKTKTQNPNKYQSQNSNAQNEFTASLIKKGDTLIGKLDIKTQKEADEILKDLEGAEYKIKKIERKESKKNPLPPFATSTLQQAAWQKLKYPAKMTMSLAQALYENGLITYHRTDSLNLSEQSLKSAQKFIIHNFGQKYHTGSPRKFKTKSKGAQEAHEAIRPTEPENSPEKLSATLDKKQLKLYDLIWRRFVASQMSQAIFDSTAVEIIAKNCTFRANGSIMKFDGFLKIYPMKISENELPPLKESEILDLLKLIPSQHFTLPPPRYNDASLVKKLEELGIGRPSTYAPIISTIQARRYVEKNEEKRFKPTEMGIKVNDMLAEHFPEIVDYQFTAKMEDELDEIAEGKIKWQPVIKEFYKPFAKHLDKKYKSVEKIKTEEKTNRTCPQCGGEIVIREGRFGRFFACKNFPKCKFTEAIVNSTNVSCPKCAEGEIIERKTRKGKTFYSCSKYPKCEFALWQKPTGQKCPKCGSLLITTLKGKEICSNKECKEKK
jgi:DNA topoisomerase-1